MKNEESRLFPFFIDITGKKVLVLGAGSVAARRIKILMEFGPSITVIAPQASKVIIDMNASGKIVYKNREYRDIDIDSTDFVLAATNDGNLNKKIYADCKKRGIPVNVCDRKEYCDFQFPSVVLSGNVTVGINGSGTEHSQVKNTRIAIEKCLLGESLYD